MKKILLMLLKMQGIEAKVADLNSYIKRIEKRLQDRDNKIKRMQSRITKLEKQVCKIEYILTEVNTFLSDETETRKYFVQKGHDPMNSCDICDGRKLGILDYRETLISMMN